MTQLDAVQFSISQLETLLESATDDCYICDANDAIRKLKQLEKQLIKRKVNIIANAKRKR